MVGHLEIKMSRYVKRQKATNENEQYDKLFEKRGIDKVIQYRSPTAKYITDEQIARVDCYKYSWKHGDSFEKLAQEYYGSPTEWWVIASFNRKPTESHVELGEIIKIPISLADAMQVVE
jgi:nucleoid-associated protein YgaU